MTNQSLSQSSASDIVIAVENLSKCYLVGHEGPQERYQSLRDTLVRHGKSFIRKTLDMAKGKQIIQGDTVEEFWALKDVSFEVKQGEVLGIIGRNGAGKSTLLKILSRITEPTSGKVTLRGRVASLLEVGTGFHPELTGRENIFLNASILGMKRTEVKAKFDEIVDFADVEKFLDTPVKRYSSGMYVRLAFAVAAHLEPKILIVDEVLAVGDAEFQKKCLGKMQDVAKGGRTVLFVSHNMGAVRAMCSRAILINSGKVTLVGDAPSVISSYLADNSQSGGSPSSDTLRQRRRAGSGEVLISGVEITGKSGALQVGYLIGEPILLSLNYRVERPTRGTFFLLLSTREGIVVLSSFQRDNHSPLDLIVNGTVETLMEGIDFAPGFYSVSVGIFDQKNNFVDWVDQVAEFEILSHFFDGRSFDQRLGLMSKQLSWRQHCGEELPAAVGKNEVRFASEQENMA